MASMGSFPFVIETAVESAVLLQSWNHRRPKSPLLAQRPRKCGGFNDLTSLSSKIVGLDDDGSGGGRMWRIKRLKATEGKGSSGSENGEEFDDSLQATIDKSKKILAMQRDLLQQIADRREIISSIRNTIINPEEDVLLSEGKESNLNQNSSLTDESHDADILHSSSITAVANQSPETLPATFSKQNSEDTEKSGVDLTPRSSTDMDFQKRVEGTTSGKTWSSVLPPFVSDLSTSPDMVFQNNDGPKESSSRTEAADDPKSDDMKPPPLAGANVMNIILVAAECAPWVKTGGLGDVAGALPKALARRGHRVMVVVPYYGNYAEPQQTGIRRRYKVDGQDMEVSYYQTYIDGVDFVFIESPIFRNLENNIYAGNHTDILKRMVLFCKAAVEVPWYVPCGGVCYGDGNLAFIANDWHTALLPVYLKAYYRDNGLMKYTRSILVIHNIAHQGRGPLDDFYYVDLPPHYLDIFRLYDPVGGEHFNIFAAGLKTADRVVTVSHGYAWELKTMEGGWGLHHIINENDWKLRGIVNGIDMKDWNPEVDIHLQSDGYTNYTLETLQTGKPQCKAALQKELGLPVREDIPLLAFIGRLDNQKGVDLIAEAVPWMVSQDVQLVMLGTGRADLEQMLRHIEGQYHDKVRGWVGFSVKMAHRITAGADVLLMPSRFEPCGLNQLYAMCYGTVPVVHAVGGLRDTVQPFDPYSESGLGWTFHRAEANELIHALGNCLLTYRQYKQSWEGIQRRGMMQDLSWDNAASQYEEVLVAAKYQW